MPGLTEAYEVLLDFTNDTHDAATVQLLREYGRSTNTIVLLHPGESITLVLDAGPPPSFLSVFTAQLTPKQGQYTNTPSKHAQKWRT